MRVERVRVCFVLVVTVVVTVFGDGVVKMAWVEIPSVDVRSRGVECELSLRFAKPDLVPLELVVGYCAGCAFSNAEVVVITEDWDVEVEGCLILREPRDSTIWSYRAYFLRREESRLARQAVT